MTALSGLATPRQRVGHKLRHAWAHGTNIGDNPDYHTVSGTPRTTPNTREYRSTMSNPQYLPQ